ncbi:MAG TPA: DapH/DapD/GlmU-related protein [Acidimicrobiia bacterium]|nr:DapH/DapD/GlmU-related protein [Acidimicrobiia bacterium]
MSDVPGSGPPLPGLARRVAADLLDTAWSTLVEWSTIRPGTRRANRFRSFGAGSAICFPAAALFGERYIEIGAGTVFGPHVSLSAGVSPAHDLGDDAVVRIGDRCLIGKGSGIVGHEHIEIGDDVFTGHHVYITDANHGYEDADLPIGRQFAPPRPVSIGSGSWLGHGAIVLPGACIGRHVVVGAGSVVTGTLPDFCVAVGNPARVVRDGRCAQPPRAAAGDG